MRINVMLVGLLLACVVSRLTAQPAAVVELIEDDTEALMRQLNNDGGLDATLIRQDFREVYSGVSALHVTPFQRFSARIPGWSYPIVEKPGPGQYRYLRFAWKRIGGQGVMVQLHSNGSWNQRYYAGVRSNQTSTWGAMLQVDPNVPREWTVVTRDLFKDFGPMTLHGFALTPMEDGVAGLFDHVYLARSVEDLDRASGEAFGKTPLKDPLTPAQLGILWDELASGDVKTAGSAVRKLLAGRKESVPFLANVLRSKPASANAKQIARWIDELDDEEFRVRENAHVALDRLGDAAVRFLQEARLKSLSVEQRNRIDGLLKNRGIEQGRLTNSQLRLIRAARVLEWSNTPEALAVLESLAKEPPDAAVSDDVRQARERLAKALKR